MARQASLIFDHVIEPSVMADNYRAAEMTIKEMCSSGAEITPASPRMFALLVKQMRMLDLQTLEDLRAMLTTRKACPLAM